jgi:hypothetical protein
MGDPAGGCEPRWTAGVVTLREYQFGDRRGPLFVVVAMVG